MATLGSILISVAELPTGVIIGVAMRGVAKLLGLSEAVTTLLLRDGLSLETVSGSALSETSIKRSFFCSALTLSSLLFSVTN